MMAQDLLERQCLGSLQSRHGIAQYGMTTIHTLLLSLSTQLVPPHTARAGATNTGTPAAWSGEQPRTTLTSCPS